MNPAHHPRRLGSKIRVRRWLPRGRLARRSRGLLLGGLWLRFLTWRRARSLDQELARGADPLGSDALSLRTGQLRSGKTRARLARSLLAALELADRQLPAVPGVVPLVRRLEVQRCRDLFLELAERLRDRELNVQGVAMISRLVTQGDSPLYDEHAERSLGATLRSAILALETRLPSDAAPPRLPPTEA
jgi:hypothetical protein